MIDKSAYWCWSDLSTWRPLLDSLQNDTSPEDVHDTLRHHYAGYRAFHGCKAVDIESYRRCGILAHDRDQLHAEVKARIRCAYPDIDPTQIDEAINEATPFPRPEVCAFMDRRYSVGEGKEFCIRGSEMPLRVATILHRRSGVNVVNLFTEPGTPTLIEFGVDWADETHCMKVEIQHEVQAALGLASKGVPPRVLDWAHVHKKTVPAEMIFGIEHPIF